MPEPLRTAAAVDQAWAILHANDSCDHTLCQAPDPRNLDRSCLAQRIAEALVVAAAQAGARGDERARAIEEALSRLVSRIPEGDPPDKEDWHHIYVGKDEAEYARAALLPPEAPRDE